MRLSMLPSSPHCIPSDPRHRPTADQLSFSLDCRKPSTAQYVTQWPDQHRALLVRINGVDAGPYRTTAHREERWTRRPSSRPSQLNFSRQRQENPLSIGHLLLPGLNKISILAIDDLTEYEFSIIRESPSEDEVSRVTHHHSKRRDWEECIGELSLES